MNAHSRTLLLSFLGAVLLTVAGCSDDARLTSSDGDDVAGTNSLEEIDLDQSYGGLDYDDEPEAFGDAELLAEWDRAEDLSAEIAEADSLVDTDPGLAAPDVRRTYLRILWGQLDGMPRDSLGTALPAQRVDWSGKLSVSEGAVAFARLIRFEQPFDHRLPRSDRQTLEWVSHTAPHFDGILVCVLSRPDSTGAIGGELSFRTGPFSQKFDVAELDGLDEIHEVDELGNAISFTARTVEPGRRCASGFLAGFWHAAPETAPFDGGILRGLVLSESGRVTGFLKGRYGIDAQGDRVFAGKLIGRQGRVRGLVEGTWMPAADGRGMGSFQGHWAVRSGVHVGQLRGQYESRGEGGMGFFHGQWAELCDPAS